MKTILKIRQHKDDDEMLELLTVKESRHNLKTTWTTTIWAVVHSDILYELEEIKSCIEANGEAEVGIVLV